MALSNLYSWSEDVAPSACGAACGAADKPAETPAEAPAACGAADKARGEARRLRHGLRSRGQMKNGPCGGHGNSSVIDLP